MWNDPKRWSQGPQFNNKEKYLLDIVIKRLQKAADSGENLLVAHELLDLIHEENNKLIEHEQAYFNEIVKMKAKVESERLKEVSRYGGISEYDNKTILQRFRETFK